MIKKSILLIICAFVAFNAKPELNEKFIKNCTEEVWSMDLPAFNPATQIPDSISQNQSAVIIADFVMLDADFSQTSSYSKAYNLGNATTNLTCRKLVKRRMVKLLDDAAVSQFSSVDIGTGDKVKINTYELARKLEGFGARIHKPDGSVIDVDVMQSYAVTEGKKGKEDVEYKLQIPGLAVGDILEYFIYIYDEVDELSLKPVRIDIIQQYPILSYEFQGKFDPQLTVEYHTVNDAPLMQTAYDSNGDLTASVQFYNLPPTPTSAFFLKSRELPYYRFSILNNHTQVTWIPKIARKPGLYPDLEAGTYYIEIAEALNMGSVDDSPIKQAEKYMKSYMKAHPDEKRRNLIDRAWIATVYYCLTDKQPKTGDITVSKTFREVLRKLKLDDENTGIAVVNGRSSFPTDKLLSYKDVDYFTVVDGQPYSVNHFDECAPGEVAGIYQGETGAIFCSDFQSTKNPTPKIFTMPTSGYNKNVLFSEVTIDINIDDEEMPVDFVRNVVATGATKGMVNMSLDLGMLLAELEGYLDIPESSRYKQDEATKKKAAELFEDFLYSDAERVMGVRPAKFTEQSLISVGCLPSSKKMNYKTAGTVDGIVTDAGDGELLVNIGQLFGRNIKLLGSDRQSEFEAWISAPNQYVYKVQLNVPKGYTVDRQAIEELTQNITNPVGCYTVTTNVSEDGSLIDISVVERNVGYVVPADQWNQLLELLDASANFNETSIVLTPQ